MFTFHKPKVFRSTNGCCICKAKSSSSRFTDSKKYENCFVRCFKLKEKRSGEICNACVLLVKRFLKLPVDSTRNWHHVVDARSGPGIKSMVRKKDKTKVGKMNDDNSDMSINESPDKILKKKHVYKKKKNLRKVEKAKIRQRNPSIVYSAFLDDMLWTRKNICCGIVFIGPFGEVAIDTRYYNPCNSCNKTKEDNKTETIPAPMDSGENTSSKSSTSSFDEDIDDAMEEDEDSNMAAARNLAEVCRAAMEDQESTTVSVGHDVDEGFFDKPAISPASGGSSTPPPGDDILNDLMPTESSRSITTAGEELT